MECSQSPSPDPALNIVFDASFVARSLGLSAEQLMSELRKGTVHQITERGIDDDRGRYRIIFRYRSKECRFVLTTEGRILNLA